MSALQNAMRALSGSLRAGVVRSAVVRHALTKGELREEDLAGALRPHIPERMSLSSGVVINEWGLESSQQDLLIVDSSVSPAFVTAGRLGLHPVESVLAAIEVKSRLTTDTVTSAVRSGASLKRLLSPVLQPMRRVERHGQVLYEPETERSAQDVFMKPFTAIVGLNGDARPETLLRAFVEANLELDEIDRTNTLILIDSFVTAWSPRDDARVLQSYPQDALTACRLDMGEDSAPVFLCISS